MRLDYGGCDGTGIQLGRGPAAEGQGERRLERRKGVDGTLHIQGEMDGGMRGADLHRRRWT